MSDIQQYLLDYDKSRKEASAVAQQSATRKTTPRRARGRNYADSGIGLQNHDLKLLTLIEELGEYLISEDGSIRAKSEQNCLS